MDAIEKEILSEVNQLPENLRLEVLHFISVLKKGHVDESKSNSAPNRIFGSAKGKYRMSDDFDDPLEDFNDYM